MPNAQVEVHAAAAGEAASMVVNAGHEDAGDAIAKCQRYRKIWPRQIKEWEDFDSIRVRGKCQCQMQR